ncbi:FkbM family methyltransferase [Pseudophaeobacter sp.]|uniref:FkbM family methyltransferase n=1 Tax=Pseudophaeobacter sp. TaxID=1971739 RepID=UPI0032972549
MTRRVEVLQSESILAERVAHLGPGDLAFDCGANVGKVTQMLAQTGAQVAAFEPDPVIFGDLKARFAGQPQVLLHNVAVGTEAGEALMLRSPYYSDDPIKESEKNTICSQAVTRKKEGGWQPMDADNGVMVPVIDLLEYLADELATRERIGLLKLDIEGMEMPILRKMLTGNLFDRIDLTIAELHPWRFPDEADEIRAFRTEMAARYPVTTVNLDWG